MKAAWCIKPQGTGATGSAFFYCLVGFLLVGSVQFQTALTHSGFSREDCNWLSGR